MCGVCGARAAVAKGKCGTCYQYERRTGQRRPIRLAQRQAELNWRRFNRALVRGKPKGVEYVREAA